MSGGTGTGVRAGARHGFRARGDRPRVFGGVAGELARKGFRGAVLRPGDVGYDAGRAVVRPGLDPRPSVVVEAAGAADVRAAVVLAGERGLPFAVQATGHGTVVPADGGVLLKTSSMSGVRVDPVRRIAGVGPGARWGSVIAAAAPYGLAPLSGSSPDVGVTGYTLGGGLGWLSRKYGFAADSVVRAEVVTADGRVLVADADQNPDLWWALRGGGGNFGVVTWLEFALHPVSQVYGGTAYFPADRAADTIARLRDRAPSQPDELAISVVLMDRAPGIAGPVLALRGLYAGPAGDAVRALRPLYQAAGTPLADTFAPIDFAGTGGIGGTAARGFERFAGLPDVAIEAIVATAARPDTTAVEVRHWGGAMARPTPGSGPVGHRHVPFSVTVAGPAQATAALTPYATGGTFLNFLGDPARTRTAYTPADYKRLRTLKRTYDPTNLLGLNHNIPPAEQSPR